MMVLIGVDPHKATNAVAALNEHGELLECAEFRANREGLRALGRWSKRFPERRWAVEGANGLGRTLAQRLASAGEQVVDVPAKLSARVRVLSVGHGRKNDSLDATFTALAALHNECLARVHQENRADVIRLLYERREDIVSERTRVLNRLHTGFYGISFLVVCPAYFLATGLPVSSVGFVLAMIRARRRSWSGAS